MEEELNQNHEEIKKDVETNKNVSRDINTGNKCKGKFIAGCILLVMLICCAALTLGLRGLMINTIEQTNNAEEAVSLFFVLITFFPLLIGLLIPTLAFFISSFVLFIKSKKSCVKGIRIASKILMWISLAIFILVFVLVSIFLFVR